MSRNLHDSFDTAGCVAFTTITYMIFALHVFFFKYALLKHTKKEASY